MNDAGRKAIKSALANVEDNLYRYKHFGSLDQRTGNGEKFSDVIAQLERERKRATGGFGVSRMSALAEALLAAQRQAVASLSKAYVAEKIDATQLLSELDLIGLRDDVDQGLLVNALQLIKEHGGTLPTNGVTPKPSPETEPASQKQLDYLAKLADEKQTMPPDGPLTKAKASEAISALQAGTYNPDDYCAPF